jgi:hypothetical protein
VELDGVRHGTDVGSTCLSAPEVALKLAREYAEERRVPASQIAIYVRLREADASC